MTSFLERQLSEFVDREKEMKTFGKILASGDPPIMVIWGDGGVGKSSLLAKIIHECALKNTNKCEITWTDTRNHDYLGIMRKIRDDIGPIYFNDFTDLINYYTVPQYELKIKIDGSISVAHNASITNSNVGNIAGIIIQDLMIPEPRKDLDIPEEDKRSRLTDCFIKNFSKLLKDIPVDKPIVILLDAVEKMTEQSKQWVWGELLGSVCDGRLNNIRFVLCGRQEPPNYLDRSIRIIIEEAQLQPLGHSHIVEYLAKRGIEENYQDVLATMLMANTKGNPLQIANSVDAFLKLEIKRKGEAS
jgi:hypothetical protein